MTNENKYTLGITSGSLIGVGFTKIDANLNIALILIGAGVALQILVAVLNKVGVPVSTPIEG